MSASPMYHMGDKNNQPRKKTIVGSWIQELCFMFMSIGMENKDTMTREREREKPLCSRSTIHAADEPVRCMCCTMFLTYKRVCINSRSKYSRFDSSGYSILYGVQSYTLKRIIQCRCKKEDKWHQAPIGGFYQSSVIH